MKYLLLAIALMFIGCSHNNPTIDNGLPPLKQCNYESMEHVYTFNEYEYSPELVNAFDTLEAGDMVFGYCGFDS